MTEIQAKLVTFPAPAPNVHLDVIMSVEEARVLRALFGNISAHDLTRAATGAVVQKPQGTDTEIRSIVSRLITDFTRELETALYNERRRECV